MRLALCLHNDFALLLGEVRGFQQYNFITEWKAFIPSSSILDEAKPAKLDLILSLYQTCLSMFFRLSGEYAANINLGPLLNC